MMNGIIPDHGHAVETSGVNTAQIINRAGEIEAGAILAATEAEIRRQMYERIAQGNALAEVENSAHNQWRGR